MTSTGDDDGMVLIWVAVLLVILLGFGALVIDVGSLYAERRQLQNGADAAALAVASDCAGTAGCGTFAVTAKNFADSNANDGKSNVDSVCGVGGSLGACATPPPVPAGATGWVQVTTSTSNAGGNQVSFVLAPVMGAVSGKTVHAKASAAWGAAKSASTPPLVIAQCAFSSVYSGTFPSPTLVLYFHDPKKNSACAGTPPGGFGWIDTTNCTSTVSADGTVPSDPGNNAVQGCFAKYNGSGVYKPGDIVPVGLYDTGTGNGSKGTYHLVGIAAFKIKAYTFPSTENPKGYKCPINSENSCLEGNFEQLVLTGDFGGGTNYGVSVIKMIG